MSYNSSAIGNYEDALLGRTKNISFNGTKNEKEKYALEMFRYAVTELLGWEPDDAANHLNDEIVKELKLERAISQINRPVDVEVRDYDYYVYKSFPDEVNYDQEKRIIKLYKDTVFTKNGKFPKGYFTKTEAGPYRAKCALLYVINTTFPNLSPEFLYKYFSSVKIDEFLRKWKLHNACNVLYRGDALKFLHDTLMETSESNLYYKIEEFNLWFRKMKVKDKKEKKTAKK